ncbi:MAG: hypothetical protein ABJM43_14090 [Paracoccaceae bacterium]
MTEMLIWLAIAALSIIPFFKILPHFGINQYWAFLSILPIGTIALLWWIAVKLQDMERR